MAGKVCQHPGCPNLRPCPIHAPVKKAWEGSNRRAELPRDWIAICRRIKIRDDFTCRECGGTKCNNEYLEVDHIGDPLDHRDENLRTLGKACHLKKTRKQAQAKTRKRPTS